MTISLKIVWLGWGGMFWVILGFALKGCEIVSETGESLVPDKKVPNPSDRTEPLRATIFHVLYCKYPFVSFLYTKKRNIIRENDQWNAYRRQ